MRRWGMVLAAGTLAFAAGRVSGIQDGRRWMQYDGREWTKFLPREKEAYVAGFLAGGALADAQSSGATDSAAVHQAVDSLVRVGRLRFPFGHMVYVTQLNEFYWWENHLPVPLYVALRDIDGRLKGHEQ